MVGEKMTLAYLLFSNIPVRFEHLSETEKRCLDIILLQHL